MTWQSSLVVLLGSTLCDPAWAAREPLVPKDVRLDNGLWVRILEDHELPMVSLGLQVPAGTVWDPQDRVGVADLTGQLLSEGTTERSGLELGLALETLGSMVNVETRSDFTTLSADFLSRDLDSGLSILAEMVTRPSFSPEAFDQQKEIATAELQDILQDPFSVARRVLYRSLYGDHPYAWPETGTLASLARITRQDVVAFYTARYRPQGSVLAVVGDVEPGDVVRRVTRVLRTWKGRPEGHVLPPLPAPWTGTHLVLADLPGQTQAQVRMATRTIPAHHKDRVALEMAEAALGGGFTSRLLQEIRVDRSLSYDAWSSLPSFSDEAFLLAGTYTKNASVRETLDVVTRVLDDWRTRGMEDAAFQRAVFHEVGLFPQLVEPPSGRVERLLEMAYQKLPANWMSRRVSDMLSVDRARSEAAVRNWIPSDGRLVIVIGDLAQIRTALDGYGAGDWQVVPVE